MSTQAASHKPQALGTDRDVCPDYAGMSEFWALLIACIRNNGARTSHTFACGDGMFVRMLKCAEHEGFRIQPTGMTLTVWKIAQKGL